MSFEVGQRVKFRRSHDKALELTGTIVRVHENYPDLLDIATEPDGKILEVETIETAHIADVSPILEEPVGSASDDETQPVHEDEFQESARSRRKSRG